jgi:hypothetical protein
MVWRRKMDFHVFRKPKKLKNGRTVHKWYYYYLDENKKQVQRACRKCKTRKEAEDYIRTLDGDNRQDKTVLIKDIAVAMFIPGSAHVNRLEHLGRFYDISTL